MPCRRSARRRRSNPRQRASGIAGFRDNVGGYRRSSPMVVTAKVQANSTTSPNHHQAAPRDCIACETHHSLLRPQAENPKNPRHSASGNVTIKPTIFDSATDIISVHTTTPLAQAYLAIVDLHNPAVEIKLGFNLTTKTLTSQFARDNDCTVAINGEAGRILFLARGSGLGPWQGYFAQQGKVLLREYPAIPRPYLSFDPQNLATFTPLSTQDRTLPAAPYNIIWGRVDALLNGAIQDTDPNNRQPRTAMALDQDNSHLYHFVVDYRQPCYSMGFTHGEVATFLEAFGAHNAMLCDEGGSSCIYLQSTHGIANIPSDNQGQERPTYTHFESRCGSRGRSQQIEVSSHRSANIVALSGYRRMKTGKNGGFLCLCA